MNITIMDVKSVTHDTERKPWGDGCYNVIHINIEDSKGAKTEMTLFCQDNKDVKVEEVKA